jgi:hypothetical protein
MRAQASNTSNLAASLRQQLAKAHAEVAELRRDLMALRGEGAAARKLDEVTARLDRIEGRGNGDTRHLLS